MSKIKVMDEILSNKIAAGEVVEKCASVVKELVENSIDAGSTEIKVDLIEAGTREIKVTDNGSGMEKDDAVLCFSRHATSKLMNEDDLFHINTLGFRGEALASIASVSKVELKTCNNKIGTIVLLDGGKLIEVKNGDARIGTTITVSDLFYNTPARLKHLKSLYAELAYITEFMNKLALSHPDIRFTLTNNGNTILRTDGTGNLLKTISAIYGIDTVKKMVDVHAEDADYEVNGYISLPEVQRSNRNHIITIVNGRVVKNATLNTIINDSYHSYKPDNRYPIVVLNINLDPSLVDVNVHPTKMDVKFSKFEELKELISSMIRNAISHKNLIPEAIIEDEEETIINNDIEEKTEIKIKPKYETFTLNLERVSESSEKYISSKETKTSLEDNIIKQEEKEEMPEMYPVGVVHGTYIICQNEKGMYLMDQHAAKERINYEIVREKLSKPKNDSIPMLFPLTLELTNNEFIIIKENFDYLNQLGFAIEEFGINSVVIKEHPTWIINGYEDAVIKQIIDLIIEKEKDFSFEKFNDHLAATVACKMSIKANDQITISEMENLISDLRKCKNPFNCPHGRPTMIFYSNYDLEKLFKRSGFDLKV